MWLRHTDFLLCAAMARLHDLRFGSAKRQEFQGMAGPAITVAMSVYNGEPFLAESVESVLAQTFADFEFLVLDDGSSDESRATIARYAKADSRIRPILRENRGLIASLNQLLAEARAPLIARMDADDVCRPERFERQIAFLADHPDHGVIGSWSEDIDEQSRSIQTEACEGEDQPVTHEAFLAAIESGGPLLCHPAVMYRADVVRAAGGYHAAFRHCEDLDLWLRLATRTKMANIPERLLRYRRSSSQVSIRHSTEQTIGSVVSRAAYRERIAGRPDPTETLERLPAIDQLDALFGRRGVAAAVREEVVAQILYSRHALSGQGLELVLDHLKEGGARDGLWRTVVRLLTFGQPVQAARLAMALAA
jgi:GT2 family glycosyltransferase